MLKSDARRILGLPQKSFIVGNVNRNQPRKRLDLSIGYFAKWQQVEDADAYLLLHCALNDVGWDLMSLAKHYGVSQRVIFTGCERLEDMMPQSRLKVIYSALDVQISTSDGGGWGLTTMEGMACGVHQIPTPHNEQFTRTKLQFKSAAVSVQGTTISGNTEVVVPSTKMLRIGMVVSGTGIAANTFIADITDATNIILSIAATASGTVTLTFGEVVVLAQMWLDEFSHYSPFPPQDLGRQVILWPTPTVLNTQMAAAA